MTRTTSDSGPPGSRSLRRGRPGRSPLRRDPTRSSRNWSPHNIRGSLPLPSIPTPIRNSRLITPLHPRRPPLLRRRARLRSARPGARPRRHRPPPRSHPTGPTPSRREGCLGCGRTLRSAASAPGGPWVTGSRLRPPARRRAIGCRLRGTRRDTLFIEQCLLSSWQFGSGLRRRPILGGSVFDRRRAGGRELIQSPGWNNSRGSRPTASDPIPWPHPMSCCSAARP